MSNEAQEALEGRKVHPDWPPIKSAQSWDSDAPTDDLVYALGDGYPRFYTADEPGPSRPTGPILLGDIERIDRYHVDYGGSKWTPDNRDGGSELNMVLLCELRDGRWASIVAWNDYTGWGCQDGVDVRVGATRENVVRYGLDNEQRGLLGESLPDDPQRLGGVS